MIQGKERIGKLLFCRFFDLALETFGQARSVQLKVEIPLGIPFLCFAYRVRSIQPMILKKKEALRHRVQIGPKKKTYYKGPLSGSEPHSLLFLFS